MFTIFGLTNHEVNIKRMHQFIMIKNNNETVRETVLPVGNNGQFPLNNNKHALVSLLSYPPNIVDM